MDDPLLQITHDTEPVLPEAIRDALDRIYRSVPAVSCGCDKLGQCCELTEEEAADDWATMYPLYAVEYLNIVDYVRAHFDEADQDRLLDFSEERPLRCPFLTGEGGCSIHPARPLSCRTYGILGKGDLEETVSRLEPEVPAIWLRHFKSNESCTVCTHTEVLEPEKVEAHATQMATFAYDRELLDLAQTFDGLADDRRDLLIKATGKYRVARWTWGGFNTLWRKPVAWLKENLVGYMDRSRLAE